MQYAEVIVPAPVRSRFTYAVGAEEAPLMAVGKRVVVEFGRRRKYAAIVVRYPAPPPAAGIEAKPVMEVVDEHPIVTPAQLRLWEWMAGYYMCSEGEVMTAALPSGLRMESESTVSLAAAPEPGQKLSEAETEIVKLLATSGRQTVRAIEAATGRRNVMVTLRALYERHIVAIGDVMRTGYKPLTEGCVRLTAEYRSEERLHSLLDSLKSAPAQSRLIMAYLDLSGTPAALRLKNKGLLKRVSRALLMQESGVSEGVLSALREKGVIEVYRDDVSRLKKGAAATCPPGSLSAAQQKTLEEITAAIRSHAVCLLHGVTSSGKTEIYIHLIDHVLREGRSVLYLLPEIALTTQITSRLRLHFGDKMGIYHSRLSDSERVEIWQKQLSADPYPLIVGVRSSVFLPHGRLGLVIVDEEHEPSYKQEDPAPRYNARDTAIMMAGMSGARTLLGTATPSLESYHNALSGKYGLVTLTERYGDVRLPEIRVEDVKELRRRKIMRGHLSPELIEETKRALGAGEQVILFQNRRGYASYVECSDCGWIPQCERCDVSLTYHKSSGRLVCHYCGATYPVPTVCPKCGGSHLREHGTGTERIEEEVHRAFPEARLLRLDLDTTRRKGSLDEILSAFRRGEADILIGTQMVAKGLDFDRVRTVGILDADMEARQPDFRAAERAFQMMEQVSGRAGRRSDRGIVILQTAEPDSPVIEKVRAHDYRGFYDAEAGERKLFEFPPYLRLINIYVRSRFANRADDAARALAETLDISFAGSLLGPAAPPVSRVKYEYIRRIMLKVRPGTSLARVRQILRLAAAGVEKEMRVSVYFDVDPM